MTLTQEIQDLLGGLKSQVPPPVFDKLQQVFDRLESVSTGAAAPQSGDRVPAVGFTRPDGAKVSIADLYADKPLVLLFFRGRWCPFCDLSLRAYNGIVDDIHSAGARIVAASPQTIGETALTIEERRLRFDVLSDAHNAAAAAFGLTWNLTPEEQQLYSGFHAHLDKANGDDEWRLPAPAVFVVDTNGMVRWSWVDSNWTRRAEPHDILQVVQNLTRSQSSTKHTGTTQGAG